MINYQIISTGSKGNAVIVGKSILIDCGVSFKAIEPQINNLRLVLLTHIHGDHFNRATLRRLANEKPLLRFGAGRWLVKPLVDAGIKERQIDILEPGFSYDYGLCKVEPFHLTHDVPNCGFKLHFAAGKAMYATDTRNLNGITAKDYDLYLLEGNYGEEEIESRIAEKQLNGQYAYEIRVKQTHLSREQCDDFIARNACANSEYVYLHAHVDDEVMEEQA